MFHYKKYKIFKELPNVLGIADDILVEGYDTNGRGHKRTLRQVMQTCHKENLKLNKNQWCFRCIRVHFIADIVSRHEVLPDAHTVHTVTNMPPPHNKKEFQSF